jgi:DnaJ domain
VSGAEAGGATGRGITWYDILGVLPTASAAEIQREYEAKASVLRPEMISGASSTVVSAAARAQGILDAARRVLGDPVNRERYDEAAGYRHSGEGLDRPEVFPTEPGWGPSDVDFPSGVPGEELMGGLMALTDWLTPHARQGWHIPVPDVRGLFYDVCLEVAGRLGLAVTTVRLTEHPMPVDGLVVGQSPLPPAKVRRAGALTVQVWHPPARPAGQ